MGELSLENPGGQPEKQSQNTAPTESTEPQFSTTKTSAEFKSQSTKSATVAESSTAAAAAISQEDPKPSDNTKLDTSAPQPTDNDSLSIEPSDPPPAGGISSSNTKPDPPVCNITLLLPTGARHPYRIDEKYLAKRNVSVPETTETGAKDPFSISVYKLKELILREWREEWEAKPASPSSIRLIHFGKLLDDKEPLKSMLLPT